jgi:hypothetical protein
MNVFYGTELQALNILMIASCLIFFVKWKKDDFKYLISGEETFASLLNG